MVVKEVVVKKGRTKRIVVVVVVVVEVRKVAVGNKQERVVVETKEDVVEVETKEVVVLWITVGMDTVAEVVNVPEAIQKVAAIEMDQMTIVIEVVII